MTYFSRWANRQAGQDPNFTAEQLTETANRLLHRQFIMRGDHGGANHFDRMASNQDYYKDLFASFGFRFIFNDAWGYAGFVSPTAYNNNRVPTQETIVLLCLRLLYNEGAEKGYFVDSSAQVLVEEEEIQTVFSSIGSRSLNPGELREILKAFKRKGLTVLCRVGIAETTLAGWRTSRSRTRLCAKSLLTGNTTGIFCALACMAGGPSLEMPIS